MEYELVKQLKDAGFPVKEAKTLEEMEKSYDGWLIPPTLSELIEACGEDFNLLIRVPDNTWEAGQGFNHVFKEKQIGASGSTPEEAVAKLWLQLNKK